MEIPSSPPPQNHFLYSAVLWALMTVAKCCITFIICISSFSTSTHFHSRLLYWTVSSIRPYIYSTTSSNSLQLKFQTSFIFSLLHFKGQILCITCLLSGVILRRVRKQQNLPNGWTDLSSSQSNPLVCFPVTAKVMLCIAKVLIQSRHC